MIERRGVFDIANDTYLDEYFNRKFIDNNNRNYEIEIIIYKIIFVIFNILAIISLIFFYLLRRTYMIHQRNFVLTFIGGIFIYLNVIFGFLPQMILVPCFLTVFSATFLNPIANLTFFSRTLRIILFYRYNIYKVTSIKKGNTKRNINRNLDSNMEPNNYLQRIYNKINRIISFIIIIPTSISVIITLLIYLLDKDTISQCPFTKFEDAMINIKLNRGSELFYSVIVFGVLYILISFIFSILLLKIKDTNKYGVKFESLSVCILIFVVNILNIILQLNSASKNQKSGLKKPRIIFLKLFEITKGGKILFSIVSIYMFFVSITLPVIQYYLAKKSNSKILEKNGSIQYFYKVLNTPYLVNELKNIAVKEFSVENVLFWENYQILQKMVYSYQLNCKNEKEKSEKKNNIDNYSNHQHQINMTNSIDEYKYYPNMPVPKEILPYYISFYHMFIESNGLATVSISRDKANYIYYQLISLPTIGMYDSVKDDIVEIMYTTIFPILLKKNKEHILNV